MSSTQIKLWKDDGWWIATDIPTGVTSQGETREAALSNLDEAVELHDGDAGRSPTDADLDAMGVDVHAADDETGETEVFE